MENKLVFTYRWSPRAGLTVSKAGLYESYFILFTVFLFRVDCFLGLKCLETEFNGRVIFLNYFENSS